MQRKISKLDNEVKLLKKALIDLDNINEVLQQVFYNSVLEGVGVWGWSGKTLLSLPPCPNWGGAS